MIEAITMYRVSDGKVFNTMDSALSYEKDFVSAGSILEEFPDNSKLGRADFYQLTKVDVDKIRAKFCNILRTKYGGDEILIEALREYEHDFQDGELGHILSGNDSPYHQMWVKLECIDDEYRMFNQPYFVLTHSYKPGKEIPIDLFTLHKR